MICNNSRLIWIIGETFKLNCLRKKAIMSAILIPSQSAETGEKTKRRTDARSSWCLLRSLKETETSSARFRFRLCAGFWRGSNCARFATGEPDCDANGNSPRPKTATNPAQPGKAGSGLDACPTLRVGIGRAGSRAEAVGRVSVAYRKPGGYSAGRHPLRFPSSPDFRAVNPTAGIAAKPGFLTGRRRSELSGNPPPFFRVSGYLTYLNTPRFAATP